MKNNFKKIKEDELLYDFNEKWNELINLVQQKNETIKQLKQEIKVLKAKMNQSEKTKIKIKKNQKTISLADFNKFYKANIKPN